MFTASLEIKFHSSDPRGKNHPKYQFFARQQNNDLSLKLNPTRQHESRGILSFQNRVPDIKILKFHANQDNSPYLKEQFSTEARLPILRLPLNLWHQNESKNGLRS